MADKRMISRTFNVHLFEFLDDLIRVFPDNLDIQTAKTSLVAMKQVNPVIIIKTWFHKVYTPYKEVIDSNNIEFFLMKDYSQDLSKVNNATEILSIIDTLRGPISNMTEPQKKHTMEYLQNLSKLSVLYSTMK